MKVRFIINPVAGGSNRTGIITDAVKKVLASEEGIFEIKKAEGKGHAGELASEAVAMGYEAVFACGGDGTINEVASSVVGTDAALGIVPAGSGNALANSLGIPGEPGAAIALLKQWKVREIDAGVACGRYFFTTAGFAFEALLSKKYNDNRLSKKIRGVAPYVPLAVFSYLFYRPEALTIDIDGEPFALDPLVVTAANTSQFGGKAFIAPDAVLDDGLLDFCLIRKTGLISAIKAAIGVFNKKIDRHKGYQRVRGKSAVVHGGSRYYAHVDGEAFEWRGEARVSVMHRKLKVLVP